jgi:hypothetical protein
MRFVTENDEDLRILRIGSRLYREELEKEQKRNLDLGVRNPVIERRLMHIGGYAGVPDVNGPGLLARLGGADTEESPKPKIDPQQLGLEWTDTRDREREIVREREQGDGAVLAENAAQ